MIEVAPNLFVGSQDDLHYAIPRNSDKPSDAWFVISAAKHPFHQQAVGYTTRAAPKDHPEYLMAVRDRRLILNLIDADDPAYIPDEIINTALHAIGYSLTFKGEKVLIHCNKGQSRAPTIAMLYLAKYTDEFAGMDYEMASDYFRGIYPTYAPARGMEEYAKAHWPSIRTESALGGSQQSP